MAFRSLGGSLPPFALEGLSLLSYQLLSLLYKSHLLYWLPIVKGYPMMCPNECFSMLETIFYIKQGTSMSVIYFEMGGCARIEERRREACRKAGEVRT